MKVRVRLQDLVGFTRGVEAAIDAELAGQTLSPAARVRARARHREVALQALERWVGYGEFVILEFDTDQLTAVVAVRTGAPGGS